MSYKLVVCDLDGTLLSSEHKISEYTKNIIKTIHQQGIKFIIATGRPHLDAKFFKNQLGLDSFLITSNGARAHDELDNKIISEDIPMKLANEILSLDIDTNLFHRNIYLEDDWFIEYEIDGLVEFHKESGYLFKIKDFEKFKNLDLTKMFFLGEDHHIEKLENEIKQKFNEQLSITISSPFCLEIMKKGVNKGNTLKQIAKKLGIDLREVIAFGDGMNDYNMLKDVGKSFIMKNASQKLKNALPHVEVIDSCDENGVAKKLEEIFL